jgi:hypothetical protein
MITGLSASVQVVVVTIGPDTVKASGAAVAVGGDQPNKIKKPQTIANPKPTIVAAFTHKPTER